MAKKPFKIHRNGEIIMAKTIIIFQDEERDCKPELLRRVDRIETAWAFIADGVEKGYKEAKIEGEGLKQIYYFFKSDVDALDKLLIHSPEKFAPKWPSVIYAWNHWKDTYALLKSMQKTNGA